MNPLKFSLRKLTDPTGDVYWGVIAPDRKRTVIATRDTRSEAIAYIRTHLGGTVGR